MNKSLKTRGFASLPLIIGGAIIVAGLIGGVAYELNKNNLAVGKNKILADVSSVATSSDSLQPTQVSAAISTSQAIPVSTSLKITVSDGEPLIAGKTYIVSWSGSDPNNLTYSVYLDGSAFGGKVIYLTTTNQTPNMIKITIPSTVPSGNDYKLQFMGKAVIYESDPFTIMASATTMSPTITSISPDRGFIGETITITGSGFGTTTNSNTIIMTSTDGYEESSPVLAGAYFDGTLRFTIPSVMFHSDVDGKPNYTVTTQGGGYNIVVETKNGKSNPMSLTIPVIPTPSSVKIISPDGSEAYAVGSTMQIRWTGGVQRISLVSAVDTSKIVSVSDHYNTGDYSGLYSWVIPSNIIPGKYYLQVEGCCGETGGTDKSAYFTIASASQATIQQPNQNIQPSTSSSSGLSSSQIQSILNMIRAFGADESVINKVQSVLGGQPASGTAQAQWCYTFNTDLGIGSSGADVSALQTALEKENLQGAVSVSGVYNESTAALVTGFQEKYKNDVLAPLGLFNGTGYVGQSTRNKLNALYGCNG